MHKAFILGAAFISLAAQAQSLKLSSLHCRGANGLVIEAQAEAGEAVRSLDTQLGSFKKKFSVLERPVFSLNGHTRIPLSYPGMPSAAFAYDIYLGGVPVPGQLTELSGVIGHTTSLVMPAYPLYPVMVEVPVAFRPSTWIDCQVLAED